MFLVMFTFKLFFMCLQDKCPLGDYNKVKLDGVLSFKKHSPTDLQEYRCKRSKTFISIFSTHLAYDSLKIRIFVFSLT